MTFEDLRLELLALAELEESTAKRVANDLMPEVRGSWFAGDHADEKRGRQQKAKLEEQRNQAVAEAANELLSASTDLRRPSALVDAIEAARKRLETAPSKTQGLRT